MHVHIKHPYLGSQLLQEAIQQHLLMQYLKEGVVEDPYLGSQSLQEAVQQHLLVQDLEEGVVEEQPLPASALHKLVNDDGNDQVQHDEVHAKNEGYAVDG